MNGETYTSNSPTLAAGSYSITALDSNQCGSPTPATALLVDPEGK